MWMVGVTAGAATGEVAQGVQVGRVHRADHERTAARDAALPFEVGGDLRSRRARTATLWPDPTRPASVPSRQTAEFGRTSRLFRASSVVAVFSVRPIRCPACGVAP